MEYYIWGAFILCITVILALIGVVYNSMVNMIAHANKKIDGKIDKQVCEMCRLTNERLLGNLKDSVVDLKEYNERSHDAIMSELRKK